MATAKDDKHYYAVPSKLVHWMITSIIASIIAIGVYMVTWAFGDIQYKTATTEALKDAQREIHRIEQRLEHYPPQWLKNRVENNRKRLEQLESDHRDRTK